MQQHIETFLLAKAAGGLAPRTVNWYRSFLHTWADFHPLLPTTSEEIEAYLAGLRRRGHSAAAVAGHYRALSALFNWLVRRGKLPHSPMPAVTRPKLPPKRPSHVTAEELRILTASLHEDGWSVVRDRALCLMFFYTGLRLNEAVNLHTAEVDYAKRLVFVRRGKGGPPRLIPFASEVSSALLDYLYRRPPSHHPELWLANDGAGGVRGVLTDNGVRQMLRRRCKAAGLRHLNPHAFRHGFAMWTLNSGMELSAVAAAMGHSSTQVTQRVYARWLPAGLQREYEDALNKLRGHSR